MNSQVLMWEWRKKKEKKEAAANRKSKNLPRDVIAIDPTAGDGEESSPLAQPSAPLQCKPDL